MSLLCLNNELIPGSVPAFYIVCIYLLKRLRCLNNELIPGSVAALPLPDIRSSPVGLALCWQIPDIIS